MNFRTIAGAFVALALIGCEPATESQNPKPETMAKEATPAPETPEPRGASENQGAQEDTLTDTGWWVEDIGGAGVVDRARTTVEFIAPGRVAGSTGCNQYTGTFERDDTAIRFGPLAGTRKMCPEALMRQEQRFFEAMDQVASWHIDPATGLLHLRDTDGNTVIRASNLAEAS